MSEQSAPLAGLYLEDSFLLGFAVAGKHLRFRGLFALTVDHEQYAAPKPDEQHCYHEGEIILRNASGVECEAGFGKPMILFDPDGSMDLGSITIAEIGEFYRITTEWFEIRCRAGSIEIALD